MVDIFDTQHAGKEVKLENHRIDAGEEINLTAKDPTMKRVLVGLGWDLNAFNADAVDLDVSLFLIGKDGLTRIDEDFIFYNNTEACEGAIRHNGDSRTGAGDGDDESISIDLNGVPFDVMQLVFTLSIYKGEEKSQNLGLVRNAYIRFVNAENHHELLRFELDDHLEDKGETAMIAGTLNREGPKWHFKSDIEFVEGGLGVIATRYGLTITNQ